MNILYITNFDLSVPCGGTYASSAYINAFDEISNHNLYLIYTKKHENDRPDYLRKTVKLFGYVDRRLRLIKLLGYLTGKFSIYNEKYFEDFLINIGVSIDMVVLERSLISGNFVMFFNRKGFKTITICHNVESKFQIEAKTSASIGGHFKYFINKNERIAVNQSCLNLTLTQQDLEELHRLCNPNSSAKFDCTGIFEFENKKPIVLKNQNNNDAIACAITGNLAAYQTQEAILYFINELFPHIKTNHPNVKIIIAGRSPNRKLKEICDRHVQLTLIDSPENMDSVISSADIYICPNRLGSGIKLRIMDGLKLGLPVITHSVSASGYDLFKKNEWFRVYNSKDEFCSIFDALINLINHKKISKSTIQNEYYNYFSFESGVGRLRNSLITIF